MTVSSGSKRSHAHSAVPNPAEKHHTTHQNTQGKDILVFCDGTGKDGDQAGKKGQKTNIYRLYQLAGGTDLTPSGYAARSDVRPRMLFYVRGVGAGSAKNPVNLLARVFGATIVESIVAAYLHISRKYQPGDDIYLFGYSRGAFVARKVASLIYRIGLGVHDRTELLKRWSKHEKPVAWAMPDSSNEGKDIRIKCLVVWDTVGAVFAKPVGRESDLLGMPDSELPPNVEHALHAMAFHENRRLFRATLFNSNGRTRLREIWFPGAHADVGGGGKSESDLPNISLLWVIGEMAGYLKIPNDKLEYPDLGTLTPTDAYHDSSPCRRLLDKCETRLESKLLKPNSFVHETVAYLRNALPSSLDPRPRPTPYILSLHDLSVIEWDIKAYLVSCNTLENLKRSASMTRKMMRSQVSSIRASISILPNRTPRSSNAALPPSTLRDVNPPRSKESSTYLPNPQDKVPSPAASTLNLPGHTPHLPNIVLPPSTLHVNPPRPKGSSTYLPSRQDEAPSLAASSPNAPSFTPRPPIIALPLTTHSKIDPPRSKGASTYLPNRQDEAPPLAASSPNAPSCTPRPPIIVLPPTTHSKIDPPRPKGSSTYLPSRQGEAPSPAAASRTLRPPNVPTPPTIPRDSGSPRPYASSTHLPSRQDKPPPPIPRTPRSSNAPLGRSDSPRPQAFSTSLSVPRRDRAPSTTSSRHRTESRTSHRHPSPEPTTHLSQWSLIDISRCGNDGLFPGGIGSLPGAETRHRVMPISALQAMHPVEQFYRKGRGRC